MTINKFITLVIGLMITGYEIISIFEGQTIGAAAPAGYSKPVYADENPIYFWFTIILGITVGVLLIIAAFEKDIKK